MDAVAGDRQLVEAVLAGRPGAFEQFVERHQRLVWHVVYRMVQHPEDTRELSQEAFLRIHQRLSQFRFESSLATWVGRVAFNVAARHLERKRIPIVEAKDEEDRDPLTSVADNFDLAAACENDDLLQQVHAALETLPPLLRTIVTLFYLEDLSVPEIGQLTNMPTGTVKSHLFRARQRLRESLHTAMGGIA